MQKTTLIVRIAVFAALAAIIALAFLSGSVRAEAPKMMLPIACDGKTAYLQVPADMPAAEREKLRKEACPPPPPPRKVACPNHPKVRVLVPATVPADSDEERGYVRAKCEQAAAVKPLASAPKSGFTPDPSYHLPGPGEPGKPAEVRLPQVRPPNSEQRVSEPAKVIRVWVVEQNSSVTECALGKLPFQYGACVKTLYDDGRAKATLCPHVRIGGVLNAMVPLQNGYGHVQLSPATIAALDVHHEPVIELFVPGVPELLFLPKQPKGQECCYDRMVSLPNNRQLGIVNDLHRLVRHPEHKRWLGYTIIVPPGSCKGPPRQGA